jgi:hypothetical protein
MAARIVELADLLVTAIQTAASTTATVERVWEAQVNPDDLTSLGKNDRRVWVFPLEDADGGPVSRAQDSTLYTFGVLVAEKCFTAGAMPRAWIDERVQWVDEKVKEVTTDARDRFGGAYPESRETDMPDADAARAKVFWMLTRVTLRDE